MTYAFTHIRVMPDLKGLAAQFTWTAGNRVPPSVGVSVGQVARLVGFRHFMMNPGTNENQSFELNSLSREQSFDEMLRVQAYANSQLKPGEERPMTQNDINLAHLDTLAKNTAHQTFLDAWDALKTTWSACADEGKPLPPILDTTSCAVVNTYRQIYMPKRKLVAAPRLRARGG